MDISERQERMERGGTDGFGRRKAKTIWIFMTDEAVAKRWREGREREQSYVRKT